MFKSFSKINLSILSLSLNFISTISNDHQNEKIFHSLCNTHNSRPLLSVAKKKCTRRASGRSSAAITCSRRKSGISSATRNDPDIRQRDANALFTVDKIGTVEKEKRKRRGGGYARLLVCLIRVVNPPSLPPSLRCKARAQRNRALETLLPSYFPESSSSSSSRAHRFPFHPPSASPSPFRSFRPFPLSSLPLSVSLFRPLER